MVSQLCRVIDQGNGRGAWNVPAAVGGDIGYIADKSVVDFVVKVCVMQSICNSKNYVVIVYNQT